VFITLIVAGHHLADDPVRTAWRAAGDRLVLISDAVAAAGAPDGDHTLRGTVPIPSAGGVGRTPARAPGGPHAPVPARRSRCSTPSATRTPSASRSPRPCAPPPKPRPAWPAAPTSAISP